MGQANESPSIVSTLLSPSFILAVGGLVAFLLSEPALRSQRPDVDPRAVVPPPPSPRGMHALHTRLWEDPIAVAYQHWRQQNEATAPPGWLGNLFFKIDAIRSNDEARIQDCFATVVESNESVLCLPVLVRGEPYDDDSEHRKRTTYAILSALGNSGYAPSFPDRLTYIELPVLVENQTASKPIPVTQVVPVKLFHRIEVRGAPQPGFAAVLVCWINEDQLGDRPLAVIAQVLDGMFGKVASKPERKKIQLRILGPADSDTLIAMAREDSQRRAWKPPEGTDDLPPDCVNRYLRASQPEYFSAQFGDARLLVCMATVATEAYATRATTLSTRTALGALAAGRFAGSGLRVTRAIGTDAQLCKTIATELMLRGAWPDGLQSRCDRQSGKKFVVLISEQDTSYGRAIEDVFRQKLYENTQAAPCESPDSESLQVFTYLRGLDGKSAGDRGKSDGEMDAAHGKPKSEDGVSLPLDSLRTPGQDADSNTGTSQFDYLRRLEYRLHKFHDEKRAEGAAGITAIGVVGTDVYDKLLILRALRKRFPKAVFFTTDLDAELSRKSEYPTARNLVVVSHFGLRLNPRLQRQAPPFRNSYQTATCFATLLALEDPALCDGRPALERPACDPWGLAERRFEADTLQPLVFEIGRHGPYQLTQPKKDAAGATIHPESSRKPHWLTDHWIGILALGVILGGLAGWTKFDHRVRRVLRSLSPWDFEHDKELSPGARYFVVGAILVVVVLLPIFLLAARHDHFQEDGEPFVLLEGISIWPSTCVRFGTACLAVLLAIKACLDLRVFRPPHKPIIIRPLGKDRDFVVAALCCTTAFLVMTCIVFSITDYPGLPYRGDASHGAAIVALVLAVVTQVYLTFFVARSLLECRHCLQEASSTPDNWPQPLLSGKWPACDEVTRIKELSAITRTVGCSVKYPLIVIVLMIASRHPAFDLFEWSWPLAAVWGLLTLIVVANSYSLRQAASHARRKALERLRDARLFALRTTNPVGNVAQINQYISEVEAEQDGAFAPWTQDPLFRALGYFAGGVGGIQLLQQFLPYV
jgi:hypothetical protein